MLKLSIILFLLFVLVLSFESDGGFPESMKQGNFFPYIIDKPFTEDGFYMMTVAWNIAEGNGIKYNFNRPTTGIQPMMTFIQAGIAKIVLMTGGDKIIFLRVMIIFCALLLFLFSLVTASIVREVIPGSYSRSVVIFIVIFSFDLFDHFTNGLETGLYILIIGICISYSFRFISNPDYKRAFIFGCLSGIATLARVDFLLPFFVYLLFLFTYKKIKVRKLITAAAAIFLFLFPWLFYVYDVSGTIYPSSASVQTALVNPSGISERIYFIFISLLVHLTPFIHSHNLFISLAAALVYAAILYYMVKRMNFLAALNKSSLSNLAGWGFSFSILYIIYFIYSGSTYFYIRYTTPFYVFVLLIAVCALLFLLNKIPDLYRKLFYPGFVLFFFAQAFYYLFNGNLANHLTLRVAYIKNNIKVPGKIGLFQSGVTGFFVERVLNLDGKMDNVLIRYSAEDRFGDFLDSMNVNAIIEWEKDFNVAIDKEYFEKNWKIAKKDIGDGTTSCFVRITSAKP